PSSDTKCGGETVTQTRSCKNGWTGTDSRTVSGTKPAGQWLPSVANVCKDKDVVQSNGCRTRTVKGTKECAGDCTILHPAGWSATTPDGQSCYCTEYLSRGPGGSSVLPNGQTRLLSGSYCQVSGGGGISQSGNGSVTVKCTNGGL